MYNVLFPSGRVLELCSLDLALVYCKAYNGTLLPEIVVDNVTEVRYNASVVNDIWRFCDVYL